MADIDLLFTVADSSQSDILNTFKALQATINSSYTDIKYKVDPSAKAEIEALTASIKNLNDVSKKGGIKPSSAKSTVAKEAKEVEAAYHKIMSLQEQINKRQVKLLDSKTSQSDVVRLTREIEQLTQKRKDLASEFRTKLSSEQFQGIRQHAIALKAALKEINTMSQKHGGKTGSTESDAAKEAKEVERAYKEILSLQSKMSKAETDMFKTKKTQAEIDALKKSFQDLKQKRDQLQKDFGAKFSSAQNDAIKKSAEDAANALETAKKKLAETQQKAAEKIQVGLDLGTFDANISAIEKKFNGLKNAPDGVKDKIAELRTALAQMASASASGDYGGMLTAFQQYNTVLQSLKQNYSTAASAEKEFEKATRDAAAAAAQAEAEAAAAAALLAKNSEDAAALQERVAAALKDTSPAALAYRGKLKEIADGLREVKNESDMSVAASKIATLTQSLDETERSISRLQGAFGKVRGFLKTGMTQLFGISSGFMAFRKAAQEVKQMYGEVAKIDASMIDLRKVTDETEDTYDSFLSGASKNAQKLGTTIDSLVEQTATWAKLGFSLTEASDLSKVSTMYQKVAEVSGETAVSDLVTAIKAFDMSVEDASSIGDKLNELGKHYCPAA